MKTHIISSLACACVVAVLASGCGEVVAKERIDPDAAPQPTATSLDPDHGTVLGGTTVTITGSGFGADDDVVVVVGGNAATNATVVSDTEITFTTPPSTDEDVAVEVTVSTQNGFAVVDGDFRYNPQPRALAISPSFGRASGGTTVTITGRGFVENEGGVPTVTVAGAALANVQIVDDDTITGDLTAAPSTVRAFEPVDVVVSNTNGSDTLAGEMKLTRQGLIGLERSNPGIYYIDPTDGYAVRIATAEFRMKACVTTASGTIFATRRRADNQFEFGTLEPLSGAFSALGLTNAAGVNKPIGNLVFAGATLFGGMGRNGRPSNGLFSINMTNGSLTQIGLAPGATTVAHTALGPRDATTLWLVDLTNTTLDTISVATGAITAGAALTGGDTNSLMNMVSFGGVLYGMDRANPPRLYTITTATAALSFITTSMPTMHGACQTPPSF